MREAWILPHADGKAYGLEAAKREKILTKDFNFDEIIINILQSDCTPIKFNNSLLLFNACPAMANHPLDQLPPEDREFVLRFVLASGSLKEVAKVYGVSYPTLRNRLDKLIERLRAVLEGQEPDEMAELLAAMIERGQLSTKDAQRVLQTHREQLNHKQT